ncbi:hypothetical protein I308_103315 [Cryptococcus tetragattii IND107]|uniref:EamA domain-containing protein n=1 Tax=Cryptococcus tetragattii IND107 TaxID=1296105 RepID=A0ABR3BU97_9TREE|nr:hypothetical protein I308_03949 [Cryptococcus tetragattii IND107]
MTISTLPFIILGGIVIASAAQTEFAHYVAAELHYDQPYFSFYLTHSTFSFIFPIHLLYLSLTESVPVVAYLASIRHVLTQQLELASPIPTTSTNYTASWSTIFPKWCRKVILLTILVTVPALSWFIAMQYSTPVDISSIYATSSFAAYGFSLLLLKETLNRVTIGSIVLAFMGVIVISVDGMGEGGEEARKRALGDSIMLFGALVLGLYEVIYKLALPEGHGGISSTPSDDDYSPLPPSDPAPDSSSSSAFHHRHYRTSSTPDIPLEPSSPVVEESPLQRNTSISQLIVPKTESARQIYDLEYPIPLPPALHANFLTSCIGIATLLLLWPPIIWLDWMGYEVFKWPGAGGGAGGKIWLGLEVVAWGGALYNAGLMALIGIWGPTTSSVANLLAIGLVAIVDALWIGTLPDLQTFIGVGMICAGFGVLLWEGEA